MRIRLLTIFLLASFVALASPPNDGNPTQPRFGIEEFDTALSYYTQEHTSLKPSETLNKHFVHLKNRQVKYKTEIGFTEYAFYYIHQKLLKNYTEYASLDQTLTKGAYDCVTATAMYALFLFELDVPYAIVETNYHIYILGFPGTDHEVLMETTDPVSGFITNKVEVEKRKALYAKGNSEVKDNQVDLGWNVEDNLKDTELIGLLLFNQSVKHYNNGNKEKALELANEAVTYYSSPRILAYIHFLEGNQFASR